MIRQESEAVRHGAPPRNTRNTLGRRWKLWRRIAPRSGFLACFLDNVARGRVVRPRPRGYHPLHVEGIRSLAGRGSGQGLLYS